MAAVGEEYHDHNIDGNKTTTSAASSHDQKAVKVEADADSFWVDDTAEYAEKYRRYQADYSRRIKAKYFSKIAFDSTPIFSQVVTIENEVIKASRFPCTRSFIDPVLSVEDQSSLSASAAETSTVPSTSRKNMRRSN